MTTDKTIKSKNQPKQTNVTWVDLSGKTPVEKHFINGQWRPIGGGGGGSLDYSSTKQTVTLFDDTVETQQVEEDLYQGVVLNVDFDLIAGEIYTVVFDGTSYDVKAIPSPFQEGMVILGEINNEEGPSFETYPFAITYVEQGGIKGMLLHTNIEGSHTVVIKHEEETVTTTPEFKDAVDSVTGYSIDKGNETLFDGTVETEDDNGYIFGVITPGITFVEGDTYKVTLNGTEYTCKCFNDYGDLTIGATYTEGETYDWSTYPFSIATYNVGGGQNETTLVTNQEGSYTLKIEHLSVSTKTTPEFASMVQGIAGGGSASGCQIIYPDSISWGTGNDLYSQYNKEPEAGNIYFIPFTDDMGNHLCPVHIDELTNDDNEFSGSATIIDALIFTYNETLSALYFDGQINPTSGFMSGLRISYSTANRYRLRYQGRNLVS